MRKVFFGLSVITVALLTACGGGENSDNNDNNDNNVVAKNDGCLDFAIAEKYGSLDPIRITDVASFHIASQVFEPLLRFDDKNLSLKPLLAESWEVADDNVTHTFSIRKGVYFHDNACFEGGKGRELKASDIVYSFSRIYASEGKNYAYSLLRDQIQGAEKYKNEGGAISGIEVVDDYTVKITLNEPSSNFLSLMATISTSIVAKEAIEKGEVVGTGPFTYDKANDNEERVTLARNEKYYMKDGKGEQLPYLSCVSFNYVKNGQEQLDLFMKGELDIITGLPSKSIKEIVEQQIADFQDKPVKYVLGRYPQAATTFINLNTAKEPFNNVKVRQAIAMAINKSHIVDQILKGEAAAPGDHGIVTSAISNYDYSSVVGLEYNVEKAKELLSQAGYPNGKGFPTLILASGKGNTSLRVAFEIQKQLVSNLNINVEISSMSLAERTEAQAKSEVDMTIKGWLAEFPDPISFLSLFYGKDVPDSLNVRSYPNEARYKNAKFDKLYEEAIATIDMQKRYELCLEADQIVASEVPGIALWYHEDYHLIQSTIEGYQPNAMNIQYLTTVKIVPLKKEKAE